MAVCTGLSACGGGSFMRRLTQPESVKHWSPRIVQTKLIKMGGGLVRHDRRLVFQSAAAHRTPVHDATDGFVSLMGKLTVFVSATRMALVEDGALLEAR